MAATDEFGQTAIDQFEESFTLWPHGRHRGQSLIPRDGTPAAKERINVKTSVMARVTGGGGRGNPVDQFRSFLGKVTAKKGCQEGRTVVLVNGYGLVGSDKSNARGKFKIVEHHHARSEHGRSARGTARYRVVVEKRKITKNSGDRIVCKTGEAILENSLPVGTWPGDPGYER